MHTYVHMEVNYGNKSDSMKKIEKQIFIIMVKSTLKQFNPGESLLKPKQFNVDFTIVINSSHLEYFVFPFFFTSTYLYTHTQTLYIYIYTHTHTHTHICRQKHI